MNKANENLEQIIDLLSKSNKKNLPDSFLNFDISYYIELYKDTLKALVSSFTPLEISALYHISVSVTIIIFSFFICIFGRNFNQIL